MTEDRKQSLRCILSEAITELCRREAFYIAELRIEGTICVVSDRSSALIIHLTEQVGDKCSPQLHSNESKDAHDAIFTVVEDSGKDVVSYNREVFDKTQMEQMNMKVGLVERSEGKYNCPFCSKRYRFKHSLKDHINKHTGNRPHECKHCSVRFIHLSSLCAHVRRRHSQVRVADFRCEICNDVFSTEQFLKQHHTWKHKGERKKSNQLPLVNSNRWAESKITPFQFPFNNSIINYNTHNNDINIGNNNNNNISHNSNNNIGDDNNICSHNIMSNVNRFTVNNNLNNNSNNMNKNTSNNSLNSNPDDGHFDNVNIKEDEENASSITTSPINNNKNNNDNNNNNINESNAAGYEGSKDQLLGYQQIKLEPGGSQNLMTPPTYFQPFHDPFTPFPPSTWPLPYSDNSSLSRACNGKFQCPHCDKSYNFKHTLKEHINKHLGRRPNICKHCGDSFIHLASLCAHIKRVHQELIPADFVCGICGDKLMNFQSLKQHYTWRHREAKLMTQSTAPTNNIPPLDPSYIDDVTKRDSNRDLDFLQGLESFNIAHFSHDK